jgi:hypothetical protein
MMRALDRELLLEAWERGAANLPIARPLALLETADSSSKEVVGFADLSLAERDARLFRLRQMTFGDRMCGVLPCESCSARIEFDVSIEPILNSMENSRSVSDASWPAGSFTFTMRPVTTRDLANIAAAADPRSELLQLCTSVEGADAAHALAEHEDSALDHFEELNGNSETRFITTCAACGESGHVDLDIGAFLWTEVRHAAITLLREVHELASAYGWSEAQILGMSAARRATYLEMAGS